MGDAMETEVEFSMQKVSLINYYGRAKAANISQPDAVQKVAHYVQNKSKVSKKVRVALSESSDPVYQLLSNAEENYLAAGLKLPIVLKYDPQDAGCHVGEIVLYVDDQRSAVVPIEAIPPMPQLQVHPSAINFGHLVCEHQLVHHSLTISNAGLKEGKFSFLIGQLPNCVTVSPLQGTLKPGQALDIKVELLCKNEGSFSEQLRVTTDDSQEAALSIPVHGVVTYRQLEILDPSQSSETLEKVAFGDVYYDTVKSRKVLLFNNCPVSTQYLAVINSDSESKIDGVDVDGGLTATGCSKGGQCRDFALPGQSLVQVLPMQGTLEPFEKKIVDISFAPQYAKSNSGWNHRSDFPADREYAVYVQFIPVGQVDHGSNLEIAVTGTARALRFSIEPDTTLDFSSCHVGRTSTKTLVVHNNSDTLPIDFCCRHVAHYKCVPSSGTIIPRQEKSIAITFQPRQLGLLSCRMYMDILCSNKGKAKKAIHSIPIDLGGEGIHSVGTTKRNKLIAHPNDLATSVRPHDGSLDIVTPYTGVPRYTYVDPDYSFSPRELEDSRKHKQSYVAYNRQQQTQREWRKQEKALVSHNPDQATDQLEVNDSRARDLSLPRLSSSDDSAVKIDREKLRNGQNMLTSKDIISLTSIPLEFKECCPSKPVSSEIKSQCSSELTPTQLRQISFDPAVLDFGSIVVDHVIKKSISVSNFTQKHVRLGLKLSNAEIQCQEYKKDPVFILSPKSFTKLTLCMQRSTVGVVERSVEYCINGHHNGHLPVKANCTQLSLSLSSTTLVLTEPYLASNTAGLRGAITITNEHSVEVPFQWHAREEVDTDMLYMLHPSGIVSPGCSLKCEFVCQPTYECPSSAQFLLAVGNQDANSMKVLQHNILTLIPKFNKPVCDFREKRLLFGTVPLNLTSTRIVHIENRGRCHAYFKIREPSPLPGMNIYCEKGCVPVGGTAELKVTLTPQFAGQFDVTLKVDLKEGKCLSLRIAGSVEYPCVSVNKDIFRFGGVYCGATAKIPFIISNKGSAKVQLLFDLSFVAEFSLTCPPQDDPYNDSGRNFSGKSQNNYIVDVPKKSSVHCELQFCPQTVASHDYQLPILVNGLKAPSPPPSMWPPSSTPSTITLNENLESSFMLTPTRRVLATVMSPPLLVTNTTLNFSPHPDVLNETAVSVKHQQTIMLKNISERPLSWALDCSGVQRLQDKTFQFCDPSGDDGIDSFPFPNSLSSPAHIQPGEEFVITALCHPSHHGDFFADVPLILDGDVSKPYRSIELKASFPSGRISVNSDHIVLQPAPLGVPITAKFTVYVDYFTSPVELEAVLPKVKDHVKLAVTFPSGSTVANSFSKVGISCQLEFNSIKPISMSDYIIIRDKTSNIRKRIPFTTVADNCLFTFYTFQTQKFDSTSVHARNDNLPDTISDQRCKKDRSIESSLPPFSMSLDEVRDHSVTTFADVLMQDSVSALCRWLSAYGWSNGMKSLLSPLDLRIRVGEGLPKPGVKQRSDISESKGLLIDSLTHLCGRVPPGIPMNLPPSTTALDKINQQYSSYYSVTSFLKNQGGLLWCVVPETLLDYQDFCLWLHCQNVEGNRNPRSLGEFDELSKQIWTYLLMQIIKVLVLPRVMSNVPEFLKEEVSNLEPLDSNIYSVPERVLLAWLNFHYEKQKGVLKRETDARIQNFDVDLSDSIVLACALVSYCPFLVETHFEHLYTYPSTPEQCSHNAIIFVDALKYIGINYDIQPTDVCSSNPIFMILFVLHLYERIPSFKPNKTLVFETVLGESVNKQLQVNNSAVKQKEYRILIRGEGGQYFHVTNETESFMLPGNKTRQLDLCFSGLTINQSSAILFILASGTKAAASSVQAFRLQGCVTLANIWVTSKLSTPLYNVQTVSLAVSSPIVEPGRFEISLSEFSDTNFLSLVSSSDKSETAIKIPASSLQNRSDDGILMFELASEPTVHLEAGCSTVLVLKFVPLKLLPRLCAVILKNKELGDFVVSVYATVKLPQPIVPESPCLNSSTMVNTQTRTLHLKTHAGQSIDEEIIIQKNNVAFENAILEISKWDTSNLDTKHQAVVESFKYAIKSKAFATLGIHHGSKMAKNQPSEGSGRTFSIQGNDSQHFQYPEEVSLSPENRGSAVIPIGFHAESEGQYECRLVVQSPFDIRVLIIESTVLAASRHTEVEFKTKAMMSLTQEIPLVNPSTVDWPLVASLNGTGFVGPGFIVAQGLSTTPYPLTFSPKREGIIKGELHLFNDIDKSEYLFKLSGIADRPIAQDHIKLCVQAGTSITHILHVRNHHNRTMVFQVESDLDFMSGPSTISIGGEDVVDYPLSVSPRRQGHFTGAVSFVAQAMSRPHSYSEELQTPPESCSSFHIWFQVDCMVEAALPDKRVSISCPTFSSTTTMLNIANPHPYQLELKVLLKGLGLSGPERLKIQPDGHAAYPLTFAPKLAGQTEGRVVFDSAQDGEFWYQVDLIADNPKTTNMLPVSCELGKTCTQTVSLTNPLDIPVTFKCNNTNTKHFVVTGLAKGELTISPHSNMDVNVLFKPSAIGAKDHSAQVTFISEQFGRHMFILHGQGILPSTMDPMTITANLKSSSMKVITFINPLDVATRFSITLEGQDIEHFCLLMKRTHSILLHPGVSLDIPIMFAPEIMRGHRTMVIVTADESYSKDCLCWSYPVLGQPELRMDSSNAVLNITCRAKERLEQTINVTLLNSIDNTSGKNHTSITGQLLSGTYSYKLVCQDAHLSSLADKSTGIRLLRRKSDSDSDVDTTRTLLEFVVVFNPPKAFKCSCDLHIARGGEAVWIFPVHLVAEPALPDDTIVIEATGLNKEAKLSFRLSSTTKHPAPFTARLVGDSNNEICVSPMTGKLAPVNAPGTLFCITYKPTLYGRKHLAKFIVQSESNEWCYDIVGKVPSIGAYKNTCKISNAATMKQKLQLI